MVEDAGGLLTAAAVERAEDHLYQVLSVVAALLRQPHHHLLQQEPHGRVFGFHLVLLLSILCDIIHFHQSLRHAEFKECKTAGVVTTSKVRFKGLFLNK